MKTLLIISAVVLAVFGLSFFLVPAQVLSIYDPAYEENLTVEFAYRYFGAALFGLAVVQFFARNAPQDSQALRAVLYGGFIGYAGGVVVSILIQLSEVALPSVWFNVALLGIFTLAFGYFAFVRKPSTASPLPS